LFLVVAAVVAAHRPTHPPTESRHTLAYTETTVTAAKLSVTDKQRVLAKWQAACNKHVSSAFVSTTKPLLVRIIFVNVTTVCT
jgi:hypothetical protein